MGQRLHSTGRKLHILLTPKLSIGQKANYWASIWYWYSPLKQLIYIMSPIMFSCFGYIVMKCTLRDVLIFWLPMYIVNNITVKRLSHGIRTPKWTKIYETALFPFLLFPVLAESLSITLKKFKITSKESNVGRHEKNIIYTLPFALLCVLSVIGVARCVGMILASGSTSPVVVTFWLLSNLFNLVMSTLFVSGRRIVRNSERVFDRIGCEIETEAGGCVQCVTKNFSETGIALLLDFPVDIGENETVTLTLTTERYKAKLKASVVNVSSSRDNWTYAFKITDTGNTYGDYLQILYDRVHTLPSKLSGSLSSFDDLRMNINRRTTEETYMNRKYPRIEIDEMIPDGEREFHVVNFNYKFILLDEIAAPEKISFRPVDGLVLECVYDCDVYGGKKLYAVKNYGEFHRDKKKQELLSNWLRNLMEHESAPVESPVKTEDVQNSLVADMLGGCQDEAECIKI